MLKRLPKTYYIPLHPQRVFVFSNIAVFVEGSEAFILPLQLGPRGYKRKFRGVDYTKKAVISDGPPRLVYNKFRKEFGSVDELLNTPFNEYGFCDGGELVYVWKGVRIQNTICETNYEKLVPGRGYVAWTENDKWWITSFDDVYPTMNVPRKLSAFGTIKDVTFEIGDEGGALVYSKNSVNVYTLQLTPLGFTARFEVRIPNFPRDVYVDSGYAIIKVDESRSGTQFAIFRVV